MLFLLQVCEVHFSPEYVQRTVDFFDHTGKKLEVPLKRIKLREGAIPTILPNCPQYLSVPSSSRESTDERRTRKENNSLLLAIQQSITAKSEYDESHMFNNFCELVKCLKIFKTPSEWTFNVKEDRYVLFFYIIENPIPSVPILARINNNLQISIFINSVELKQLGKESLPLALNNLNRLSDILESLKNIYLNEETQISTELVNCIKAMLDKVGTSPKCEIQEKVQFLKEQVSLLPMSKECYRYSPEFLVFCSILYTISPHCYKFFRNSGYVTVPHPNSINKVCSIYQTNPNIEQNDINFLMHVKQKFNLLKREDHIVTLMIDEIHIKPYMDFSGGKILGSAHNSESTATSAHVFMVQSLRSNFKEVVHILPIHTIKAEYLFNFIKRVIIGLHNIGFSVICVVSDNNAINRKAMSFFSSPPKLSIAYPHPCNSSSPLFFSFDTVHLLKCIRNNWLNQKDEKQTLQYPPFNNSTCNQNISLLSASFACLKKIHLLENNSNNLVKFSYRLHLKALSPTNFERQNVKYVLDVFNEHVIQGLLTLGNVHSIANHQSTAEFIRIILNWWNIVSVKSLFKDERFKNPMFRTLAPGQENFLYLEKFLMWLDCWNDFKIVSNKLTKETQLALSHSTHALIELTKYCIEELHFNYILPGKIQTDSLEARFGKYRTMAGSQYLVSLRQIFEVESKIRIQNLLPLTLNSNSLGKLPVPLLDSRITETINTVNLDNRSSNINGFPEFDVQLTDEDFSKAGDYLPVFTYLAGYCGRGVLKRSRCDICCKFIVLDKSFCIDEGTSQYSLIKNIDRGGLLYPHSDIVNVVILNYLTVQKLINSVNEKGFLSCSQQRDVVIHYTEAVVKRHNFFLTDFFCPAHDRDLILYNLVKVSTNILLSNYVKIKNDNFSRKSNKKRKLSTVKN